MPFLTFFFPCGCLEKRTEFLAPRFFPRQLHCLRLKRSALQFRPPGKAEEGFNCLKIKLFCAGRNCMIGTGGSMATAITMLRRQGARRVFLAAAHPVLIGSAALKLCRCGVEAVLATDTLDKAVSTVSVAPLIARALRA